MTVAERVRRTPLVAKLTLAYAVVAVVVLSAVGGVIFLRFEQALNRTIDADLRSRAQALAALVEQQGTGVLTAQTTARLLRPQGAFAQIVDRRSGRVVGSTSPLATYRVLSPGDARRLQHATAVTRTRIPDVAKRARFAVQPVRRPHVIVIVGRSLKDREGANESFARALLIGGPLALLLASAAAYGLARAALRPVELMRRRAATISAGDPHARLPIPPADDEIGRLGQTLNEMLSRLDVAFDQQRDLTANASHELRTPLSVLISRLEIALRRERSPEELRATLEQTLEEARRLSALADDLLDLARLDTGRAALDVAAVDVPELLTDVAARFASSELAAGRRIETVASALTVDADLTRLEQALANLVTNALRHGGGTVTLTAARTPTGTRLSVRDEGPGIPADFAARAFDRFERHAEARAVPGSGLGLAIVKAVALAHGGSAGTGPGAAEIWMEIPHR